MAQRLVVEIIGDSSQLERTFQKSSRDAKRFEASIGGAGRVATRAFGGVAAAFGAKSAFDLITSKIGQSIDAASDLNEQLGKTKVVFKSSAAEVEAWSKTTSASLGLSQRQALATASSFGALFAPMGLVGAESAKQSRQLTELGADLASFYNTDVQDALDAIKSGIVGEAEPLRRYGVLLSETRVQQEALAETGKRTATSLTVQEKAHARIALILRDSAQAHGDAARSSGRLAQQQKILAAQVDDLHAALGEALLPVLTDVTKRLNKWLADPEHKKQVIDTWTTAINDLAGAALGAAHAIDAMIDARNRIKDWPGKGPSGIDLFKRISSALGWTEAVQGIASDLGLRGSGSNRPPGGSWMGAVAAAVQGMLNATSVPAGRASQAAARAAAAGATTTAATRRGATAEQRNQWFDALIGRQLNRVQDVSSLRGQIARLQEIAGLVRQRLAITKDVTRRLTLEDQLLDIQRDIRDRQDQIQTAARQRYWDRRRAAQLREQAKDERRMGWLEFAADRAEATKTLRDDRAAYRALERELRRRIREEGRTLELVRQLWEVRQKIRDLNKSKKAVDPLAGLVQVSSRRLAAQLAAGTGLGAAGRRILEANIAGAELRPLHVHVEIDGREVGRAVTREQARGGYRTARQTSGYRG